MKVSTYELTNRVVKELRFNTDDIDDIKRAESNKTRLENEGFNLKKTIPGFNSCNMVYVKFNQ